MTTSITHTADQEKAIRFYKKQYNAANGTSLTNGQYADLRVAELFNQMVITMNDERDTVEFLNALKTANDSQKAAARLALNITEP